MKKQSSVSDASWQVTRAIDMFQCSASERFGAESMMLTTQRYRINHTVSAHLADGTKDWFLIRHMLTLYSFSFTCPTQIICWGTVYWMEDWSIYNNIRYIYIYVLLVWIFRDLPCVWCWTGMSRCCYELQLLNILWRRPTYARQGLLWWVKTLDPSLV